MTKFFLTIAPETEFSGPFPSNEMIEAETRDEALRLVCPRFDDLLPAHSVVATVRCSRGGKTEIWRRLPFTDWQRVR